ncbi:conserved protein of unknown function [Oenococcus oeni]|uniref:Uncharacterized protein n=2 Tax=Oenococcus oeni TaxID=1247 RepID=A0AAQ2ZFP8_OENOE|nr:hypothetical protein AWRIB429_0852 [Oenococcus oeni AWRIB429]KZD14435.1 hypothetical protein AC229_1089 [Oenococcus oeni]SYW06831.1 conserved hypothetical protein [Oenococcus oeni]SYW09986.1 conserved hypothetical protein [Oenococcus oeni]SYW13411.1 conserved hypothetical protein [Oenococcus oeni]
MPCFLANLVKTIDMAYRNILIFLKKVKNVFITLRIIANILLVL